MLTLSIAAFVVFGALLVLPGSAQPALARELGLDMQRTGLLASSLSLGLGAGVVLGGPLVDRFPRRPVFAAAACASGGALLVASPAAGYAALATALALAGLGAGCFETVLNATLPAGEPVRGARRLALAHAGATVGAVLGPFAIAALAAGGAVHAFRALGALLLALAGAVALVAFPPPVSRGAAVPASLARDARALAPFALGAFAYVGVETALTALLPVYVASGGLAPGRGVLAISAFWSGLFSGRLAFAALSRRAGPRPLARAALVAAVVLAGGALAGTRWPEAWLLLAGAALGAVFPVLIALAGDVLPERRGRAAGFVAGAGALGGTLCPWLTGALGDSFGAPVAIASLGAWSAAIALVARSARGGNTPR